VIGGLYDVPRPRCKVFRSERVSHYLCTKSTQLACQWYPFRVDALEVDLTRLLQDLLLVEILLRRFVERMKRAVMAHIPVLLPHLALVEQLLVLFGDNEVSL